MPSAVNGKKSAKRKGTRRQDQSSSEDDEDNPSSTQLVEVKKMSSSKLKKLAKEKIENAFKEKSVEDNIDKRRANSLPFMPLPSELTREAIGSKSLSSSDFGDISYKNTVNLQLSGNSRRDSNAKLVMVAKVRDEGFIDEDEADDYEEDFAILVIDKDVDHMLMQNSNVEVSNEIKDPAVKFSLVSDVSFESDCEIDNFGSAPEDNNNSNSCSVVNEQRPYELKPLPFILANQISYHPLLCSYARVNRMADLEAYLSATLTSDLTSIPGIDDKTAEVLSKNEIKSPFQLIGKLLSFKILSGSEEEGLDVLSMSHIGAFWVWVRDLFMCSSETADLPMICNLAVIVRSVAFKTDVIIPGLYCEDSYPPTLSESLVTTIMGVNDLATSSKGKKLIRNNDPRNNVPQNPILTSCDAVSYLAKCEHICIDMCSIGGLECAENIIQNIYKMVSAYSISHDQQLPRSAFYESILKMLECIVVEGPSLLQEIPVAGSIPVLLQNEEEKKLIASLVGIVESCVALILVVAFVPPLPPGKYFFLSASILVTSHERLCRVLVSILSLYKSSIKISETICEMFSYLAFNNNHNRVTLGDSGICEVLIDVLQMHITSAPLVVENACRAVGNICYNEDNKKKMGRFGTCKLLSQVLVAHKKIDSIIEAACLAICNLSYKSESNQDKFGQLNVCQLLVELLNIHMKTLSVSEQICRSIVNLAFKPKNKELLKKRNAMSVLNDVICVHGPALGSASEATKRLST